MSLIDQFAPSERSRRAIGLVLAAAGVVLLFGGPFWVYPLFLIKVLCIALFACAYNFLLGTVGLLSFGHAAFYGWGAYIAAHAAKEWGFPFELSIVAGTLAATALGAVIGFISVRRQGLYFAMITLALAQTMYFVALQAPFTHSEDGIQRVPRGHLFGVIDLSNTITMYYTTLGIVVLGFLFIYRVVHSPFGQVLEAVRENPQRALSLGYDVDRFKLVAFTLSAALSGVAGSTKAIAFQFASLSDVHWIMSGDVILIALLGGIGTVLGPLVGAVIFVGLDEVLAESGLPIGPITGALFVLCILAFRRGIVGEWERFYRAVKV